MKLSSRPTADELQKAAQEAVRMLQSGRAGPASRLLKDLLHHLPGNFDALHLLGLASMLDGKIDDALRHLGAATEAKPTAAAAWNNLATAYRRAGRLADAVAAYRTGLGHCPDHAGLNGSLCDTLLATGARPDALAQAVAFAAAHPRDAEAQATLGTMHFVQAQLPEAETAFRAAMALAPKNRVVRFNLAVLLVQSRRAAEAVPLMQALVAEEPRDTGAREMLVAMKRGACDWAGLEILTAELLAGLPKGAPVADPVVYSNLTDKTDLIKAAAATHAAPLQPVRPPLWVGRPVPHEKLRLGYVRASFPDDATTRTLLDLVGAHDRDRFEVHCIALGPGEENAVRTRLETAADRFADLASQDMVQAARSLRARELDVLIDLSMPADGAVARVLAHRVAPLQVRHLGFAGSTGTRFIDYLVADPVVVPQGREASIAERVVRLPGSFYAPAQLAPVPSRTRGDYGLPMAGVVLAAFNGVHKITPPMFQAWLRILAAVPDAVLWLRTSDAGARANLRREAGAAADRVVFADQLDSHAEHLGRLPHADLYLDTNPFGGRSATYEALWSGVPVVTMAGQSFASRVAASQLTAAGLPELVTPSLSDYEAKALELARSPDRRRELRARLAQDGPARGLFDLGRYTRSLEAAFTALHARAASGQGPAGLDVKALAS